MAVGEAGAHTPIFKCPFQAGVTVEGPPVKPYRSHPHYPATTLTVIAGGLWNARVIPQRTQARHSGSTLAVQLSLLKQPAVFLCGYRTTLVALCYQPAQIGIGNCVVETCNAFTYSPHSPPQQAFCGEQSHLGIVGYLAFATIGRGVVGYAVRAKAAQNFSAGYELN